MGNSNFICLICEAQKYIHKRSEKHSLSWYVMFVLEYISVSLMSTPYYTQCMNAYSYSNASSPGFLQTKLPIWSYWFGDIFSFYFCLFFFFFSCSSSILTCFTSTFRSTRLLCSQLPASTDAASDTWRSFVLVTITLLLTLLTLFI